MKWLLKHYWNWRFLVVLLLLGSVFLLPSPSGAAELSDKKKLRPGDIFKDCKICPEMIVIPVGKFRMGSTNGKKREQPITEVVIPRPLAVSRYEITFDEWDACHADSGCTKKPFDRDWGRGKRPVMNVTHDDVREYMVWISKKTGFTYRLPSEAEWEYAARAGSDTEYWWGDRMQQGAANCRGCGTEWSGVKSAPVGSFKANPWGLFDVHGNVLEHVFDCWSTNLNGLPKDGLPKITKKCGSRVVRGGAWYYFSKVSRSASRVRNDIRIFSYFIGFRAFREIE